jgi:hypothetical protein
MTRMDQYKRHFIYNKVACIKKRSIVSVMYFISTVSDTGHV